MFSENSYRPTLFFLFFIFVYYEPETILTKIIATLHFNKNKEHFWTQLLTELLMWSAHVVIHFTYTTYHMFHLFQRVFGTVLTPPKVKKS